MEPPLGTRESVDRGSFPLSRDERCPGDATLVTAHATADHVVVLDAALAQLPAAQRSRDEASRVAVLVWTDAAGATGEFAAHLAEQGVEFSVGASLRPPRRGDRAGAPTHAGLDTGPSGP